ncbi:MAG: Aerobic carbon monoxide dehydrogenase (quinone), large chain [uncultured Rubrobacteraceae bacterium]|uniref:Aerobic carbon monoxide dehydrogenase (Quinone), large chain n=1 Tax=uncultured Rubrobacteraceae bacterium TaxID=349277 RepID=A0A6J4QA83_9ACTN|nr:MAG: Aerobic carbon monoxide dehydrogenase (quinone), large chain [uncultured Rubrobacteraceae bacterium]
MGGGLPRKEDPALVTGRANWTDNIQLPGMLHLALLRSPFAHAKVTHLDVSGALDRPGVVAAFTGEDLADEWPGGVPCAAVVTEEQNTPFQAPIVTDEARYMGDVVAVVLATDRYKAQDALESIEVDYEPLGVVVDMESALEEGSPLVHEELGTNECFTFTAGVGNVDELFDKTDDPDDQAAAARAPDVQGEGDTDAAFAKANVVIKERYIQQRLLPTAIEPRATVAFQDPGHNGYVVYSATQVPHLAKIVLSLATGIPENEIRVVAPDVGGGFGSKLNVYREEILALVLAKKLGTPVKFNEDRSENYQATIHGRGQIQDIELAATSEGRILGLRVKLLDDMGAYLQLLTPAISVSGAAMFPGVYTFDAFSIEIKGVFTNLTPTDAYRGAGRPEAAYAIERAVDSLARKLDMDPAEVRRKNFYEPFDEPTETPGGLQYDSMNMQAAMDRLVELADYEGLRREQQQRRENNDPVQLGLGFSTYTEICGLGPSQALAGLGLGGGGWEAANVRMLVTGKVEVATGTSPHGQGHETSWAQIAADALGVTPDDVVVIHGDTAAVPFGRDTYGSRSLAVGGIAVHLACEKVVDKAKKIAAHMLEAAEDDLEFEGGKFSVAGSPDQNVSIQDVAGGAYLGADIPEGMEPTLNENMTFDPPNFTFPFGAHLCVTEVDTETGKAWVRDYYAVDDCGPVINPIIVDGQLHGGLAQGIAQALYEGVIYSEEGNLMTGSMVDYMIPGAPELPNFTLDRTVTPSPSNPLGVKGVGEAGTIGSPPAVMNSIIDALSPLGVKHMDMPALPMRVWNAIQDAQGNAAASGEYDAALGSREADVKQEGRSEEK